MILDIMAQGRACHPSTFRTVNFFTMVITNSVSPTFKVKLFYTECNILFTFYVISVKWKHVAEEVILFFDF